MYNSVSWRQEFLHGLVLFSKLLLIPIVLYSLYLGYQYWVHGSLSGPFQSYGLEEELTGDINQYGTLIFNAMTPAIEDGVAFLQVFEYRFLDDLTHLKFLIPAHSYVYSNTVYNAMIAHIASTSDPDGFQPAWHNKITNEYGLLLTDSHAYNEQEMVVSPDEAFYAYSYQATADADMFAHEFRNIALQNFYTHETITIPNASEPHFTMGGENMIYMTDKGLFRYHQASGETYLVSSLYTNLNTTVDYAITSDDRYLVLTIPSLNLISIQQFNENFTTKEIGRIVTSDTRYRFPVISPDDRFYVVMAAKDVDFNSEVNSYNNIDAEIRLITNETVVDTVSFPDEMRPNSIQLSEWQE